MDTRIPRFIGTCLLAVGMLGTALAQSPGDGTAAASALPDRSKRLGWQACHAMGADATAQLACFKGWAQLQLPTDAPPPTMTTAPANAQTGQAPTEVLLLPALATEAPDGKQIGCRNTKYSELSRFWQRQRGSNCQPGPAGTGLATSARVIGRRRQPRYFRLYRSGRTDRLVSRT